MDLLVARCDLFMPHRPVTEDSTRCEQLNFSLQTTTVSEIREPWKLHLIIRDPIFRSNERTRKSRISGRMQSKDKI
jgi:hypothetical protein